MGFIDISHVKIFGGCLNIIIFARLGSVYLFFLWQKKIMIFFTVIELKTLKIDKQMSFFMLNSTLLTVC